MTPNSAIADLPPTSPSPPAPHRAAAARIDALLAGQREAQDRLASLDQLFVIGCGKSGTTWLRNLLHGHPQISIFGEGSFAWRLLPILGQAFSVFNEHQSHGQPACTHLAEDDLFLTARGIIDGIFTRYIHESGKPMGELRMVGDKTPQHTIGIPALNTLYPRARFVHIYRDPRDVATSAWFHDGVNDTKRDFPQFIHHFMNEVWPLQVGTARQVGPTLGGDRFFELRYEDLVADEALEIRRLLEFLPVDNTPELVGECSRAGSFKKLSGGRERGEGDNSKFYRKGVTGDWENHLPIDLVRELCVPIADLMRSCGYEPTV